MEFEHYLDLTGIVADGKGIRTVHARIPNCIREDDDAEKIMAMFRETRNVLSAIPDWTLLVSEYPETESMFIAGGGIAVRDYEWEGDTMDITRGDGWRYQFLTGYGACRLPGHTENLPVLEW